MELPSVNPIDLNAELWTILNEEFNDDLVDDFGHHLIIPGIAVLDKPFNSHESIKPCNFFFFTSRDYITKMMDGREIGYIAKVKIPEDAHVVLESQYNFPGADVWRCDKMYIYNPINILDEEALKNEKITRIISHGPDIGDEQIMFLDDRKNL